MWVLYKIALLRAEPFDPNTTFLESAKITFFYIQSLIKLISNARHTTYDVVESLNFNY